MFLDCSVLALIPARSGSKGLAVIKLQSQLKAPLVTFHGFFTKINWICPFNNRKSKFQELVFNQGI